MSRRVQAVELSTFRFLFDSYVQQRRRLKFLEALVAALRTLFLLVLILVMARPVIKHWSTLFGGSAARDVILLVDCSASMAAHTDGVSSLDRAKAAARAIVERMGRRDRLSLIRVSAEPEELFSRFQRDSEKIGRRIDGLETVPSSGDLLAGLSLAAERNQDLARNTVVYLLTDCQTNEWQELRGLELSQVLPRDAELVVVDVGSGEITPNCAIVGEAPRAPRANRGLPVILRARVANYSPTKITDLPVSVFIEEKEITRIRVTINPGQVVGKDIVFVPWQEGVLKGRFEIPADRFPGDDTFLFTLTVAPRPGILLVRPDPADPSDPHQDEALYLRTALTSKARAESDLEGAAFEERAVGALELRETGEEALNADQLSDVGLVILANCGGLNGGQFALLRDFVFKGGGLIVFPGDRVVGQPYNDQLFAAANHAQAQLLSARIGAAEGDPDDSETFERLSDTDFGHPVMSVFADPDAQFLRTVRFFRRFRLQATQEQGSGRVLAQFVNGSPALVEGEFGEGRTVLAAFPANTRWTNLPMKPEFVPLVLRLVGYLARKPELNAPPVVEAGKSARIVADPSWAPATGRVEDGVGRVASVDFQWSGTRLLGVFEATTRKGYYTVGVSGGASGGEQREGTLRFSVNLAPEESDFRTVGENQLRAWYPNDEVRVVDASAQIQHLTGSVGDEREIWRPLIFLTFLLIGCEFLLSTSSGHRRTADERLSLAHRLRRMSPTVWVRNMTGGYDPAE
jgi:Mg-chelatase subunit ChlD